MVAPQEKCCLIAMCLLEICFIESYIEMATSGAVFYEHRKTKS